MRLNCPYCGQRSLEEFTYLGDASKRRPASIESTKFDEWYDYVYLRKNPRGKLKEYWQHTNGCRSWLIVERDTATHEIFSVEAAVEFARRAAHDQL